MNNTLKHFVLLATVLFGSLCIENCGKDEKSGSKLGQENVQHPSQKTDPVDSSNRAIDDIQRTLHSDQEKLDRFAKAYNMLRDDAAGEITPSFTKELHLQFYPLRDAHKGLSLLIRVADATQTLLDGGGVSIGQVSKMIVMMDSALQIASNLDKSSRGLAIRQSFTKHLAEAVKLLISEYPQKTNAYVLMEAELNSQTLDDVLTDLRTSVASLQTILNSVKK